MYFIFEFYQGEGVMDLVLGLAHVHEGYLAPVSRSKQKQSRGLIKKVIHRARARAGIQSSTTSVLYVGTSQILMIHVRRYPSRAYATTTNVPPRISS